MHLVKSLSLMVVSFFLLFSWPVQADQNDNEVNTITVVGHGVAEKVPDQVTLRVRVEALEKNLVLAKKKMDARYQQVLNVLEKHSVDEKNIKSTISVYPEYQWQGNRRVYQGEKASRSIEIIFTEIATLHKLMQNLVENEVSFIDGVSHGFQNPKELERKALESAANDARARATLLANTLGKKLGEVRHISEKNTGYPTPPIYSKQANLMVVASPGEAPPEKLGMEKITASITVTFYLL